jgi:Flp pilus assembly CpaF family ATPase
LFADFGTGDMRALGVALPASQVEAAIRLLAASAGKAIERDAPFVNLILPDGARFSAGLPPVSDGPTFSIRLHWRAVRPLDDFIAASWQLPFSTTRFGDASTLSL